MGKELKISFELSNVVAKFVYLKNIHAILEDEDVICKFPVYEGNVYMHEGDTLTFIIPVTDLNLTEVEK